MYIKSSYFVKIAYSCGCAYSRGILVTEECGFEVSICVLPWDFCVLPWDFCVLMWDLDTRKPVNSRFFETLNKKKNKKKNTIINDIFN